jgi:hypothetical protein
MAVASITEAERLERQSEVDSAIASVRLEGLEPSEGAKKIWQRYVDGELTAAEKKKAFREYLDREYGSVRLSGNKRP